MTNTSLLSTAPPVRRFLGPVLLGGAVLLCAGAASASDENPGVIQDHLGMPCAPSCAVCHLNAVGEGGTAVKPFYMNTLRGLNFANGDDESLRAALDAIAAQNLSSDPDREVDATLGRPRNDVEMLELGLDPNGQLGDMCAAAAGGPQYGCGAAHIAPHAGRDAFPWALTAASLLGLTLLFRRRRAA